MSDIDTAVVDSLTCLTPDGRLEKRTSSAGGATPAGSRWSALMTPGWAEYAAVVTASSTPVM